jgi:hypothetical protein
LAGYCGASEQKIKDCKMKYELAKLEYAENALIWIALLWGTF